MDLLCEGARRGTRRYPAPNGKGCKSDPSRLLNLVRF